MSLGSRVTKFSLFILVILVNLIFDAGNSKYRSSGTDARLHIINTFGWTINDGGYYSPPVTVSSSISTTTSATSTTGSTSTPPVTTTPAFEMLVIVITFIVSIKFRRKSD